MTKKKNSFLAFCFSLVPGMGLMYLGFMKMGISLLLWFVAIISMASGLGLEIVAIFSPVVCIYSFFLTLNMNSMSDEDFYQLEDKYIVPGNIKIFEMELIKNYRKGIAVILILVGISVVWNNFIYVLQEYIPQEIYRFINSLSYNIPRMLVGVGIIAVGFIMIRGKKKELFSEDGEQPKEKGNEEEHNL